MGEVRGGGTERKGLLDVDNSVVTAGEGEGKGAK